MQFRPGSILPVIDCHANGKRVPVTVDTGSSLGLILFPRGIRYLGMELLAAQGDPFEAAGYGGTVRLAKGWIRSLTIGQIEMGAVEAAYVKRGYGETEEVERRVGSLGNAILQDFVLTLDYRNRAVVLESAQP